jgi:hypothetical protein
MQTKDKIYIYAKSLALSENKDTIFWLLKFKFFSKIKITKKVFFMLFSCIHGLKNLNKKSVKGFSGQWTGNWSKKLI